uniref:DUF6261 family protein n=1 Tax=Roseihalotalea indica TaxID=2867963 RepID=A0AA49Q0L7_9BACT|nr:DUF6261 family protein [Tunicatimonas sp. TK19036]
MLISAHVFNYRTKEFMQFIRNTLMIVSQHGPEALQVKAQYQQLNQLYQQMEVSYQQAGTHNLTPQLIQLDEQRDQAIICLRTISEGYTRYPKATQREAGQQVLACIDRYGNRLYSLNYSAETATLKQLLHELQTKPECISALQALHLEDVVKEMKRANQEFEKLFIQRLEEASQAEVQSTREQMRQTTDAYRTLLRHLEAHATLTPSNEYQLLIDHLNENINHFNEMITRRKNNPETTPVAPEDTEA